jgi:uncharacterized protein YigE (DUF2233 family)
MMMLALITAALAADFQVVTVDLRTEKLELLGQTEGVHNLSDALMKRPSATALTNAGIFHTPTDPVGLQIEAGAQVSELNTQSGSGNFFLLPNGVFYIDETGAHTVTTADWVAAGVTARLATQSGPMLLVGGQPHPAFREDSPNAFVRSGVCASDPFTVRVFISTAPVRFHEAAVYARDVLGCTDALYLDGVISTLWTTGAPLPAPQQYAGVLVVTPRH